MLITSLLARSLPVALVLFFLTSGAVYAADTTRPVISKVTPITATVGSQVTFTATYSDDDSGVDWCNLYVEFADMGEMTLASGVATKTHTFQGGGVYTVFVHCRDNSGNAANGANTSVFVTTNSSSGGDSTAPMVGAISPTSAQLDVRLTLKASYSDAGGVTSCRLIVNSFDRGEMILTGNFASRDYTFNETGEASVYAQCADTAGNIGVGEQVFVSVSEAVPVPPPVIPPTVTPGLVKLTCLANTAVNHPCRSVYYRATDGTRHAFPNEKIYFTWYNDFSSVTEISADALAALPLGHNVTYRPGVRMVKFTTDNRVYAVNRAGLLRWVASESLAASLYGNNWNKKIDDLSDAFATDYTMGPEIMNASEYSPSTTTAGTTTIDANF